MPSLCSDTERQAVFLTWALLSDSTVFSELVLIPLVVQFTPCIPAMEPPDGTLEVFFLSTHCHPETLQGGGGAALALVAGDAAGRV